MVHKHILWDLHTWLLGDNPGSISTPDFDEDNLDTQCGKLASERVTESNIQSNKEQDKPLIWYGGIFKLGIFLKNLYLCLGLKKKYKGL